MTHLVRVITTAGLAAAAFLPIAATPTIGSAAATSTTVAVQPVAVEVLAAPEQPIVVPRVDLKEFRTSDGAGTFYATDPAEVRAAEDVHGFKPVDDANGLRLYAKEFPAPFR